MIYAAAACSKGEPRGCLMINSIVQVISREFVSDTSKMDNSIA